MACDPCVDAGTEATCGSDCAFECDDGSGGTAICHYQLVWRVTYCFEGDDCHLREIWSPVGCNNVRC